MAGDWTKHGLTQPPKDGRGFVDWMVDAFWILFEKMEAMGEGGCEAHQNVVRRIEVVELRSQKNQSVIVEGIGWYRGMSGYLKGLLAVAAALLFLTSILGNVAAVVAMLKK